MNSRLKHTYNNSHTMSFTSLIQIEKETQNNVVRKQVNK